MSATPNLPRVVDNDRDEITVTLDGKELRGWSYRDEAERRVKMLAAREFVEGWYVGSKASSLRDQFAGQFLAGAANDTSALDVSSAADQYDVDCALREHWDRAARTAYIAADAMLAAREASDV